MSKPRVITEFEKLDESILLRIKLEFPLGYEKHLIRFKNHKKALISALPYETEDRHYLIKMTREKANSIIQADEDFNENGILKEKSKVKIEAKVKKLMAATEEKKKAAKPDVEVKE